MKHIVFFLLLPVALVTCSRHIGTADENRSRVQDVAEDTVACLNNHALDGEKPMSQTPLECPAYDSLEHVVKYAGFTVSYNHTTLVPNWVAYELTAEELEPVYTSKSSRFSRDPNLKGRQASREDYSHSGWDKGHMAPKADMRWSEEAYWQSHYFTNVCPQDHALNGGDWKTLENAVRDMARQYGHVWVVCGPIFTTNQYGTIGEAKVKIPDAFFKAILLNDGQVYHAAAYVMENRPGRQRMASCAITVDQLEEQISRDLFPMLDDGIEAEVESRLW